VAPRFSIVTPSFNQGQFIERTIQSVLSQNYPSFEYVVFDGGSTDKTLNVLQRYSNNLKAVSESDKGQTDAVNKGMRSTTGELIGWINSDDIYYPGALREAVTIFERHPEIDVVYGMANHIDIADGVIEAYPTEPWDFQRLCERCFICQPATFFRRTVLDRWGYLDDSLRYCMDYEFWVRLGAGDARFHYIPKLLAGSRFYPQTKTLGSRRKVHAEINSMLFRRLGRTPARWLFNYGHVVADEWGISRRSRMAHLAAMTLVSLYAALRWNGGLSRDMTRTVRLDWRHALKTIWDRPR
jgi:glycosyltransferase involved in cell wall biosynthesis